MTISKSMSIGLQVTDYVERRITVMEYEGKRVIRKSTGEIGTIKKAVYLPEDTRYHVHFDGMPKQMSISIHHKDLIIIGEVQS